MFDHFARRGAQVAAISVDPPGHNAAMVEKLLLPFPLLSDPQGAVIQRYGLWNPDERIATPSIVVVDRTGMARWAYAGHDFADRPGDEELFRALDGLDGLDAGGTPAVRETAIRVTAEEGADSVRANKAPMALDFLKPYYRGALFTTIALKGRFVDMGAEGQAAAKEVDRYQGMVKRFGDAIDQTIRMRKS